MTAYADSTAYFTTVRQTSTDAALVARVTQVLEEVTRDLIREVGYSFFRQPASGDEDVLFDGNGTAWLHVHGNAPRVGIVSVGSVSIRNNASGSWIDLDAADWRLEGSKGHTGVEAGDPFFHVRLVDTARYRTFPRGASTVRLTDAVFGWSALQKDHIAATVALARQRVTADPSLPGGPMGPEEYGQPIAPDRWPRVAWDLLQKERTRHECWR